MREITLESLARRIEALEKALAEQRSQNTPKKDWRSTVGMFDDDPEFMEQVIAEGAAWREAERKAACEERP